MKAIEGFGDSLRERPEDLEDRGRCSSVGLYVYMCIHAHKHCVHVCRSLCICACAFLRLKAIGHEKKIVEKKIKAEGGGITTLRNAGALGSFRKI